MHGYLLSRSAINTSVRDSRSCDMLSMQVCQFVSFSPPNGGLRCCKRGIYSFALSLPSASPSPCKPLMLQLTVGDFSWAPLVSDTARLSTSVAYNCMGTGSVSACAVGARHLSGVRGACNAANSEGQPLMHDSFDHLPLCSAGGRIGRCRGAQIVAAGPGGGVLDKPTTKGLPGIDLGYDAADATDMCKNISTYTQQHSASNFPMQEEHNKAAAKILSRDAAQRRLQ